MGRSGCGYMDEKAELAQFKEKEPKKTNKAQKKQVFQAVSKLRPILQLYNGHS